MAGVRIRALTERHPIKPTSLRCHSAWQLNLGRPPLIDAEDLFRQPGPPYSDCDSGSDLWREDRALRGHVEKSTKRIGGNARKSPRIAPSLVNISLGRSPQWRTQRCSVMR